MRRFFRAHREEDYSQIQYLTSKCNRLAHDKAVLEREVLVSRERERSLQSDLETLASHLCQHRQVNMELCIKQEQLHSTLGRKQELCESLQKHVSLMVEDSSKEAVQLALQLEQVKSELLHLQSSEVQLEGLLDELHTQAQSKVALAGGLREELHNEAQHRAALAESLEAKLHGAEQELAELRIKYAAQSQQMEEQRSTHQRQVRELQQENLSGLRKLQETAQRFEWLCEQQRYWMGCIRRFKDCLCEEKAALVERVKQLERKVAELKKTSVTDTVDPEPNAICCPLEDNNSQHADSRLSSWDIDMMADLQDQELKWRGLYQELTHQLTTQQEGQRQWPTIERFSSVYHSCRSSSTLSHGRTALSSGDMGQDEGLSVTSMVVGKRLPVASNVAYTAPANLGGWAPRKLPLPPRSVGSSTAGPGPPRAGPDVRRYQKQTEKVCEGLLCPGPPPPWSLSLGLLCRGIPSTLEPLLRAAVSRYPSTPLEGTVQAVTATP
ncbi:uncharacterized protein FYW47_000575 [Aplochiton taeniatus]